LARPFQATISLDLMELIGVWLALRVRPAIAITVRPTSPKASIFLEASAGLEESAFGGMLILHVTHY
jgi:hypothetical protein